jgi:hypothetical protein
MITQWFPNPQTIKQVFSQPHKQQQQGLYFSSSDHEKASKRSISVEEYKARCALVKQQFDLYLKKGFHTHMPVLPVKEEVAKEHGVCTIIGVCWDYDLYGDAEWHDPPFILQIRSATGSVINCTVGYVKAVEGLTC